MLDLFKALDPKMLGQISQGAEEFGKNIKAILGALIKINQNLEEIKALLEEMNESAKQPTKVNNDD
ncbi:MAG TPA: hypothetical protein PK390_04115 [Fervidobacterium nodosum]|nr:hypothetical protein [Fervidobacterium nodosum]